MTMTGTGRRFSVTWCVHESVFQENDRCAGENFTMRVPKIEGLGFSLCSLSNEIKVGKSMRWIIETEEVPHQSEHLNFQLAD